VDLPESVIEAILARTPLDARPIDADAMASQQQIADTFHRLELITRPLQIEEAVWSRPWGVRRSA
jgi:sulfonate transport system substrate-binding protein